MRLFSIAHIRVLHACTTLINYIFAWSESLEISPRTRSAHFPCAVHHVSHRVGIWRVDTRCMRACCLSGEVHTHNHVVAVHGNATRGWARRAKEFRIPPAKSVSSSVYTSPPCVLGSLFTEGYPSLEASRLDQIVGLIYRLDDPIVWFIGTFTATLKSLGTVIARREGRHFEYRGYFTIVNRWSCNNLTPCVRSWP